MGRSPVEHIQSITRAATSPLPDKKTIDATRTEILAVAIAILFLVSQLVLTIWLFASWHRSDRSQRVIVKRAVTANPATQVSDGDNTHSTERPSDRRRIGGSSFRRSSTWNGHATAIDASHDRRRLICRHDSVGTEPHDLGGESPLLPNPESEDDSDSSSVDRGRRNAGHLAAELPMPIVPLSPRRLRSPLGSPDTRHNAGDGDGVLTRDMDTTSLDLSSPARLSPRSPRVVPLDPDTIAAILEPQKRPDSEKTPSRVLVTVEDEKQLENGVDDPLESIDLRLA